MNAKKWVLTFLLLALVLVLGLAAFNYVTDPVRRLRRQVFELVFL